MAEQDDERANDTAVQRQEADRKNNALVRDTLHYDQLNVFFKAIISFFFEIFNAFGGGTNRNPLLGTFSSVLGFENPEELRTFSQNGGSKRDIDYNRVDFQEVQAFNTVAAQQLPPEFQKRILSNDYVEGTLENLTVEQLAAIDYDEFKSNFAEVLEEGTLAAGSVDGRSVDFHDISWLGHLPIDAEASLEEAMLIARYVEGDSHTNTRHDLGGHTRHGVTLESYKTYIRSHPEDDNNGSATVSDIANLSAEKAMRIFKANYWDQIPHIQDMPKELATMMFDAAVKHGPNYVGGQHEKYAGMNNFAAQVFSHDEAEAAYRQFKGLDANATLAPDYWQDQEFLGALKYDTSMQQARLSLIDHAFDIRADRFEAGDGPASKRDVRLDSFGVGWYNRMLRVRNFMASSAEISNEGKLTNTQIAAGEVEGIPVAAIQNARDEALGNSGNRDFDFNPDLYKGLVILDLGHGSRSASGSLDRGAGSRDGRYHEADVVDALATKTAEQLRAQGYAVAFTRNPGEELWVSGSKGERLSARAKFAHEIADELGFKERGYTYLSVHADSFTKTSPDWASVWNDTRSPNAPSEKLQQTIAANYDIDGEGVGRYSTRENDTKLGTLRVFNQLKPNGINNPRISSTLLEAGFMSNRQNVAELSSWVDNSDNAAHHAQQVATGIILNANETQPYNHQVFLAAREALSDTPEPILVASADVSDPLDLDRSALPPVDGVEGDVTGIDVVVGSDGTGTLSGENGEFIRAVQPQNSETLKVDNDEVSATIYVEQKLGTSVTALNS